MESRTGNSSENWRPQGDSNPCYRRERARFYTELLTFFQSTWTYRGRFDIRRLPLHWYLLAFLGFAAWCLSNPAKAEDWYVVAGYGSSEYYYRHEGFGVQYRNPHVEEKESNAWNLGVGKHINENISLELTYYDLGKWSNFIKYRSDYCYELGQCDGEHSWTKYGYGRGESKAVALSTLPTARYHDLLAFIRAGLTYYWTKWDARSVQEGENLHAGFERWGNQTMVRGVGYVYGAGIGYEGKHNGIRVEYLVFPDISGSDTAHDRVTATMVNAVFKL